LGWLRKYKLPAAYYGRHFPMSEPTESVDRRLTRSLRSSRLGRLLALEDAIDIVGGFRVLVNPIRSVQTCFGPCEFVSGGSGPIMLHHAQHDPHLTPDCLSAWSTRISPVIGIARNCLLSGVLQTNSTGRSHSQAEVSDRQRLRCSEPRVRYPEGCVSGPGRDLRGALRPARACCSAIARRSCYKALATDYREAR